ncbi:up-regulator of cell proliferation-like isoform X3 [Ranitomeya variabilis]
MSRDGQRPPVPKKPPNISGKPPPVPRPRNIPGKPPPVPRPRNIPADGNPSMEMYGKEKSPPAPERTANIPGSSSTLSATLEHLRIRKYATSKFTSSDILDIGPDTMKDIRCNTVEDIPWHFLQKIMALNPLARSTALEEAQDHEKLCRNNSDFLLDDDDAAQVPIHPLDVVCAILHCSDSFLQQEIMLKMSMCQFAVPLLLPCGDGKTFTFLLWAMRDIVKRWRPQALAENRGFREDNLVNISAPLFSFVRLGDCSVSKSKFLNSILNQGQTHYDHFVNPDMESGNVQKTLSCGLVETFYFFPGASNSFPEPFALSNLHGDITYNRKQFTFLTEVSSAVFIFCRELTDKNVKFLSEYQSKDVTFYLITNSQVAKHTEDMIDTFQNCKILNGRNTADLSKKLQRYIENFTKRQSHHLSLIDMSHTAHRLGIEVDEFNIKCQEAKKHAQSITQEIKNVADYKSRRLKLQGELWKKLSKTEKEICRMKDQGKMKSMDYKNKLLMQCKEIQEKQYNSKVSNDVHTFIEVLTKSNVVERRYFFKWMKLFLDGIARKNLSILREDFKKKITNQTSNETELKNIGQKISESSLGLEHFLREMSQFYEAECSVVKEGKVSSNQRQFNNLPGIAAELLLDGFPLELIDGDASNIPLQWITDVLTELDKKTGGQCRMRVITVLGVQSSGKSTLLNTMFGLQFPVASGRCTRGAFMTLIKVKDKFPKVYGCEFILVIDTEGLKTPEQESLADNYEHDNELATLVVGLSDVTLINISMENVSDMKDTLQVVVHAFLRMNEVGKRPKCHFIHQNVPDVSADYNNMTARTKLLKDLNEMTIKAAEMEKRSKLLKFTDIIDYNPETNTCYIPNLFLGAPPMASISSGYSENIFDLKTKLLESLQQPGSPAPQKLNTFHEWIRSLWMAVKYETFIFNFRNILVAEAYDKLLTRYSELEWNFKKHVQLWLVEQENIIKNHLQNNAAIEEIEKSVKTSGEEMLDKEQAQITQELENIFSSGHNNVHLVERHKEEFIGYSKFLKRDLSVLILTKFWETVQIHNRTREVRKMQSGIHEIIEDRICRYLKTTERKPKNLTDDQLKEEYEIIWGNILSSLHVHQVEKRNIESEMLEQLKREMRKRGAAANQILQNVRSLAGYGQGSFKVEKSYIDHNVWSKLKEIFTKDCFIKLKDVAMSITNKCQDYVMNILTLNDDYNEIYSQELMTMINHSLNEKEVKKLHPNIQFEVYLMLHVLGIAVPHFQKMHENYCSKNDPNHFLNNLKKRYFSIFKSKFQPKDESKPRAKSFCQQTLKPAMKVHIYKNLGRKVVDSILSSTDGIQFKNPKYFQFNVLKELLEMKNFHNYARYINEHEMYIRNWISEYVVKRYEDSSKLHILIQDLISSICKKIKFALRDPYVKKSPDILTFFDRVCQILSNYLVITQNDIKLVSFQNTVNISQFSSDVELYLNELEEEFMSDMKSVNLESLFNLKFTPQEELFKIVIGCGKKCPFCRAPCESGGFNHREHFASAHRPKGLAQYTWSDCNTLCNSICTTDVLSNDMFVNPDTGGDGCYYKEYRRIYPEWRIQPDTSIRASDYWKFVLREFNAKFADFYSAEPAEIPDEWKTITQDQALCSLREAYNI